MPAIVLFYYLDSNKAGDFFLSWTRFTYFSFNQEYGNHLKSQISIQSANLYLYILFKASVVYDN